MRWSGILALALIGACVSSAALAATPLPFDPDEATRAWLATMGPEATARSNSYFEGGYWISLADAAITIAISTALMLLGFAKGVRAWLEKTVKFYVLVVFGMALLYLLASGMIAFPFHYYVQFVREHHYGLSTQTFQAWFGEYALMFAINLIAGAIFISIIYLVIRAAKSAWWIWATGVTIAVLVVLIALSPVYVAPLFNDYTPMQEGAQKDDILHMAQANGVPADNVYVFDVSRQSNRVTANVSGMFGTTRISLSDTLLERVSPGGVREVMGHEIGHYVLHHLTSILLMQGVLIAFVFALTNILFNRLAQGERWGVRGMSDPAGMPLAFALITFLLTLTAPISNNITRYHEHQADIFGLNASREPDGLAEAALLLSEYRKMEPSPLEEWAFYDHPSGYARIHMAMQWKAHEMAAGRYPTGPGGPPPGWRPDFVVLQPRTNPAPSPAAPSD